MNRVCKRRFYIYFYHGQRIIKIFCDNPRSVPITTPKRRFLSTTLLIRARTLRKCLHQGPWPWKKSLGKGYPCFLRDHALYFCRTSVFAVMLCKGDLQFLFGGLYFFISCFSPSSEGLNLVLHATRCCMHFGLCGAEVQTRGEGEQNLMNQRLGKPYKPRFLMECAFLWACKDREGGIFFSTVLLKCNRTTVYRTFIYRKSFLQKVIGKS